MADSSNNEKMTNHTSAPLHEIREERGARFPYATVLLAVGLVAAFGINFWQHSNTVSLRLEVAELQKEMRMLRQAANEADTQVLKTLEEVRAELDSTRKERPRVWKGRAALRRQTDSPALPSARGTAVAAGRASRTVDEIKISTETASARLTDISTDVGSVRTEVAPRVAISTRPSPSCAAPPVMGVMSGLIATNRKELMPGSMGERDYFEFTITKNQKQQRIGDIVMREAHGYAAQPVHHRYHRRRQARRKEG